MTYKLFIDDERDPVTNDWKIARSSEGAKAHVEVFGAPNEIAFDHDLGGDDTSIRFILWFTDMLLDTGSKLPEGFKYSVHSQNPIGAENIRSRMDSIISNFS